VSMGMTREVMGSPKESRAGNAARHAWQSMSDKALLQEVQQIPRT